VHQSNCPGEDGRCRDRATIHNSRIWCLGVHLAGLLAGQGRLPILGSRLTILGSRLTILGSRLTVLGSRLPILGSRLTILGSRLTILGCGPDILGSSGLGSGGLGSSTALGSTVAGADRNYNDLAGLNGIAVVNGIKLANLLPRDAVALSGIFSRDAGQGAALLDDMAWASRVEAAGRINGLVGGLDRCTAVSAANATTIDGVSSRANRCSAAVIPSVTVGTRRAGHGLVAIAIPRVAVALA